MLITALALLAMTGAAESTATYSQDGRHATVECHSRDYQYGECYAGPLSRPQLVHQTSSASCILNRTWGYNPASHYIWVAQGCAGVFADTGGYHHGRGDTFDADARMYDDRGRDMGEVVAGAVIGALISSAVSSDRHGRPHATSNVRPDESYNGCHGTGCLVDAPPASPARDDDIDDRPAFDKDGNPNFDTHGNYIGCHGAGCLVDRPD